MGSDNGTKQSSSSRELAHPRLFRALVILHFVLACGGFLPAVKAFQKQGKWYINPVKQPEEWASDNDATMKAHSVISLSWIGVAFLQYVVTPQLMMAKEQAYTGRNTVVVVHRVVGYFASALLIVFALNANYLTWKNGVAGLVFHNFLALITGTMMLWHLIRALRFIRQKQVREHISQVCGLLCWTCFPGIIRLLAIVPYQTFLYDNEHCDTMNTSGMILVTLSVCVIGLVALRWAATGETFRHAGYTNFYVLIAADFLIGWLGNTLFQCHPSPEGALLEQVPGKAWALRRWHSDTIIGTATYGYTGQQGGIFEAAWTTSH